MHRDYCPGNPLAHRVFAGKQKVGQGPANDHRVRPVTGSEVPSTLDGEVPEDQLTLPHRQTDDIPLHTTDVERDSLNSLHHIPHIAYAGEMPHDLEDRWRERRHRPVSPGWIGAGRIHCHWELTSPEEALHHNIWHRYHTCKRRN